MIVWVLFALRIVLCVKAEASTINPCNGNHSAKTGLHETREQTRPAHWGKKFLNKQYNKHIILI